MIFIVNGEFGRWKCSGGELIKSCKQNIRKICFSNLNQHRIERFCVKMVLKVIYGHMACNSWLASCALLSTCVSKCLFQVVLEVQKGSTGRQEDRCCSDWGRTKVDIVMIEFHFSVVQWHSHTEIIVQWCLRKHFFFCCISDFQWPSENCPLYGFIACWSSQTTFISK